MAMLNNQRVPMVNLDITMENGPLIEDLPIKMVTFYSYVQLSGGIPMVSQ